MSVLIGTVGLPRSGKSTWARQRAKELGCPIVNPDSVRLAMHGQAYVPEAEKMVWAIAHYMVKALFIAGHETVILDATNTVPQVRQQWHSKDWINAWKVLETPLITCVERAREGDRLDLIPVIEAMAMNWDVSDLDGLFLA